MKKLSEFQKKTLLVFIFANLILLTVSALYAHIIAEAGGKDIVGCAMKRLFFIYCPGCGGSRSLLHLFRLDFISAFKLYPPMAVLLFFLIDIEVRALLSIVKDKPRYLASFKLSSLLIIPAVLLLHFFIRNLLLVEFGIDPIGDLQFFYNS